ncbi:hypothetical protein BJ912DRAFT_1040331 [Pholiota molesta]|nr:hypothetical protein BJ912DRAFT_1040331 [Pholiota molesta]
MVDVDVFRMSTSKAPGLSFHATGCVGGYQGKLTASPCTTLLDACRLIGRRRAPAGSHRPFSSASFAKDERAKIIASRLISQDFDTCITSYEMCLIEQGTLKKTLFEYIIIYEAHRVKNVDSVLPQIVRNFSSCGRLGSPRPVAGRDVLARRMALPDGAVGAATLA